jgi:hypothetical protein
VLVQTKATVLPTEARDGAERALIVTMLADTGADKKDSDDASGHGRGQIDSDCADDGSTRANKGADERDDGADRGGERRRGRAPTVAALVGTVLQLADGDDGGGQRR